VSLLPLAKVRVPPLTLVAKLSNEFKPTLSTLAGTVKADRRMQLLKAWFPMDVSPSERLTLVRYQQR
jgi:hypothetical protein